MKNKQTRLAHKNLETFLQKTVIKFTTDKPNTAADFLGWVNSNYTKYGFIRLGFYAIVAITETSFRIYNSNTIAFNYTEALAKILEVIRRNDTAFEQLTDVELFDMQFTDGLAD